MTQKSSFFLSSKVKTSALLFSALLLLGSPFTSAFSEPTSPVVNDQAHASSVATAQNLSSAFEKVADAITPSVVSISTAKKPKKNNREALRKKLNDPALEQFKEFFGPDFFDRFQQQNPDNSQGGPVGLGTGVIIDASGLILTNNHVLGDADDVTVTLSDKRKFKAEVKGVDPKSDIAVIKIKADKLTAATLGSSDSLKIGEWVIACGNPFGLSNSITAGIVSAKGRAISNGGQFEDFIQTDAAINPGNSGGPLLNLNGEVVGINTAIFSRSGGYMGIGFAIPITMAKSVMESLISKGKVIRGWLGVGIQNLTDELSGSFQFSGTEGALVGTVSEGSPAYKAGFEQGDIITKFGDVKITDVNQLRNLVAATTPGQKIDLEVHRAGKIKVLSVKIEELSNQDPQSAEVDKTDSSVDLGIEMQTLTQELATQLRSKKSHGVVVTGVSPGGLAESAGLVPRDIIVSVNGKPIKTVKELLGEITEAALAKGVRLVVDSQGMERFVFLRSAE
jgi:serine protease Do